VGRNMNKGGTGVGFGGDFANGLNARQGAEQSETRNTEHRGKGQGTVTSLGPAAQKNR